MKGIIKNVIDGGNYKLEEMLNKIMEMYIRSYITEEDITELETLAREKANPANSYAPLQEQIDNIYNIELASIKSRLDKLEQESGQEEPEEPAEEYPIYVQPIGAHNAYKIGDKITYNGKKYICKLDNCVWSPDAYPAGWEEVTEEA